MHKEQQNDCVKDQADFQLKVRKQQADEQHKLEKLNLDQQKLATQVVKESNSKDLEKEKLATKLYNKELINGFESPFSKALKLKE